jgi:hypothetical protein
MSEEQDEAAREAAYLDNITKRKQQKFVSKTFGGGLEAAREGKAPSHTHTPVHHTPVQPTYTPQPVVHQQPKKSWNHQPIQESVVHEPVNRTPLSPRSYGEIDTTSMISKRADDDVEEALRREEERMNKKLSHTAPVGSVHVGGLQNVNSPERKAGGSQTFSSQSHNNNYSPNHSQNKPTPVHQQQHQPQHQQHQQQHYVQNSQPTGRYGEIDQTPMISKRDDSDLEEALRREEERVNKKLGNTAGSAKFGGGSQPQQQQQQYHQPVHQPVHSPVHQQQHHQPAYQPVHAQNKPSYQITENTVEEIVSPVRNMNINSLKGPGVFCTFEITGNPNGDDRPKMSVDQSSSYLFTPVPAKLSCTVECLIEGTDSIKFKLTTSQGSVIVQKYSMPFPIGREMLKRKGDTVELDPF